MGELYLPIERLVAYYASGLDLPANFHLLSTPWTARDVAELIERYEGALPDGAVAELGARKPRPAAAGEPASRPVTNAPRRTLLLTLRGTPTLYYGDEIGMRDVAIPPERRVDPWAFGNRDPVPHADAVGRRRRRSPSGRPWLPFALDQADGQRRRPAGRSGLAPAALPPPARRPPQAFARQRRYRTLFGPRQRPHLRAWRSDLTVTIDFDTGDGSIVRSAHGREGVNKR